MSTSELPNSTAQIWQSRDFSIEVAEGDLQGAVVFRLCGPFTARDTYSTLSPDAFRKTFEVQPQGVPVTAQIIDLSGVPYIDSMGLGLLVRLYVTAQTKGIRWSISGCNPRVLELFKMTKLVSVLPIEN